MKWKYWLFLLGGLCFSVILFVIAFALTIEMVPFNKQKLAVIRTPSVVYAQDGSEFTTISAPGGASDLPYKNIPVNLQNALVATEDHNFWNSSSIDVRGLMRAVFVDLWRGRLAQGGSTIQEQLAKIVYLSDEKTFGRKLQQIILGVQIDRYFTQQEILSMYLNRVFLGENCIGVQRAAMRYFGIDLSQHPEQLTLPQAALLAGLPQAPSLYDPILHPEAALVRRNQVLDNMVKYGYITQDEAAKAKAEPLEVSFHSIQDDTGNASPLFTQFLLDYASRIHLSSEQLLQGGLKIYTTVNPKVQNAIDQVFWDNNYPQDFPPAVQGKPVQGAAVFVDPATGGILGAAGSRKDGFYLDGLDRVYSYSSPGSSIKPIMEYAPAIESGKFTPNSVLNNVPRDFGGGYIPRNDPGAPASCTLSYALQTSQNVASVSLLSEIGVKTGADFAQSDGIDITANDRQHLGIAIGGLEKGVTPLMMAQAYEPFANNGIQQEAHLITRVVNSEGQTIYSFTPQSKQIMSASTAQTMTGLMQNVVQYGTGTSAQIPGWDVAGKTGTVQFDSDQNGAHPDWVRNVWFDGYVPDMVGSVYLGYDDRSDIYHLNWSPYPGAYAARIWADITRTAEADKAPEHFVFNGGSSQNSSAGANVSGQGNAQSQNAIGGDQGAGGQSGTQSPPAGQPDSSGVTGLTGGFDNGAQSVWLNWQCGTPGMQFVVFRAASDGSDNKVLGQTDQLGFQDSGANPGMTYLYTVQAVDPSTNSTVGPPVVVSVTVPSSTDFGSGNGDGSGSSNGNGNGNGNGSSDGSSSGWPNGNSGDNASQGLLSGQSDGQGSPPPTSPPGPGQGQNYGRGRGHHHG